MYGKFVFNEILFDIRDRAGRLNIQIEFLGNGFKLRPSEATLNDSVLTLTTSFFIMPGSNLLTMTWNGTTYDLAGSLALVGEISGEAVAFTGKTRYDIMMEEMPARRTGRRVRRSDADFAAVEEIIAHGAAASGQEAAVKAVEATMDIEMATSLYNENLADAVEKGLLDVSLIDDSVRRILTFKFKKGIMDDPFAYIRPEAMESTLFCAEHLDVSRELARQSIVLLKNNGVLPLSQGKRIALIGPCGDSTDMGGPWQFGERQAETPTMVAGLLGKGYQVQFEKGSDIHTPVEGGLERAAAIAAQADVLCGDYNPSGKLTMSFPAAAGQIPVYYNHLRTGRPYRAGDRNKFLSRYIDGRNDPLYAFGYGLSYTTFALSGLVIDKIQMRAGETIRLSLQVTNTGPLAGEETVQLYLHDVAASIARPVKELKGFAKVRIEPGETRMVVFEIDDSMLRFCNESRQWVVEPGRFEVFAGTSSRDEDLLKAEFERVN